MDYVIACPNCAGHLKVSDRMVGFTITCPKCGNPCIPDPPPWWKPKASGQESTLFARLMPSLPPLAVGLLAGLVMGGAGGFFGGGGANNPLTAAYRNCLQLHGVTLPTTPTTTPGQTRPTGGFGGGQFANNPTFQAAQKACANLLPARTGSTTTTTVAAGA